MEMLFTGAEGWLARSFLNQALLQKWPASASYVVEMCPCYPGERQLFLDLTKPSGFEELKRNRPAVIVHSAAVSKPIDCEKDRRMAWRVNVEGTETLVQCAKAWEGKVILLSTDQVFDGSESEYDEGSMPCPINFYGFTKAEAEKIVLQSGGSVIRMSMIFGAGMPLWDRLTKSLRDGIEISLYNDLVRAPLWIGDAVRSIAVIAFSERDISGVWHLVGPELVDHYSFGLAVSRAMGGNVCKLVSGRAPATPGMHVPLRINIRSRRLQSEMGVEICDLLSAVRLALDDTRYSSMQRFGR